MNAHKRPPPLDIRHAIQAQVQLQGQTLLSEFERLAQEAKGLGLENPVKWVARLAPREDAAGRSSVWLQLQVSTALAQTCQRCLEPVQVAVEIDRAFRFVDNEETALQEDEQCEEDLLVTSRSFDLCSLIEDEVLMALPLIARHEVCPVPVKLTVADPEFEAQAEPPNPFAQLAQLKGKGSPR